MNVLFEGWMNVPHSYAIVLCFQLVALWKTKKINIYVFEAEYYGSLWKKSDTLYPKNIKDILDSLPKFDGNYKNIDLIYRITFPYNISINNLNIGIPKCIFYTAEFSTLDPTYFKMNNKVNDMNVIKKYISLFKELNFTSPSNWSKNGLNFVEDDKNVVITHGVDYNIYWPENIENIKSTRSKLGIKENEILLMNIGAMSPNKGIIYLLQCLHILVNVLFKKEYKLLLKGISELYKADYEQYFEGLTFINQEHKDNLIKNHIIFTKETLSFDMMRSLYNACDLYISPYIAEGFNLTPLEVLACGKPVLLSETGSTTDYANNVLNNGGKGFVNFIKSSVIESDSKKLNNIDVQDLLNKIISFNKNEERNYEQMVSYISKEYSWDNVANLLVNYFEKIKNK